jgi:hypothetical protein
MIKYEVLEPDGLYWARRLDGGELEIVQVSTVFGRRREFLTVAVIGSDQHYTLEEFAFYAAVSAAEEGDDADRASN